LALRTTSDSCRYGSVALKEGIITHFAEKSTATGRLINGGVYAFRKAVLAQFPKPPCSIEHEVFPSLAARGLLSGQTFDGMFIDIGLPETLAQAQALLPAWRQEKAPGT
jgi:D-glycero-D-manno-heptose 1,7-bisphosphate phosphatase